MDGGTPDLAEDHWLVAAIRHGPWRRPNQANNGRATEMTWALRVYRNGLWAKGLTLRTRPQGHILPRRDAGFQPLLRRRQEKVAKRIPLSYPPPVHKSGSGGSDGPPPDLQTGGLLGVYQGAITERAAW